MTEAQWLTSDDPNAMLRCFRTQHAAGGFGRAAQFSVSDRKLRLFACACCRIAGRDSATVDEYEERGYFDDDDNEMYTDVQWASGWCTRNPDGRETIPLATRAALLRDIFGNPFAPDMALQGRVVHEVGEGQQRRFEEVTWLTPTVLQLAQAIYDERAFDRMPILADALEEAGCRDEAILEHCRQPKANPKAYIMLNAEGTRYINNPPGPHVRGCWVIDLVLGKE